jgi:hypothetical protein
MSKGPTGDINAQAHSSLFARYFRIMPGTQFFKIILQIWIGYSSEMQMLFVFDHSIDLNKREVLGRTNRLLSLI